jgi:hypothetical protein
MFKLAVVLLATLLVAVSHGAFPGMTGGYTDHSEMIGTPAMKGLIGVVVEHLTVKENLILDDIKITRVQTQVVNGINYKLDFTGHGMNGKETTCQAVIYVKFDSTKSVTSAQC